MAINFYSLSPEIGFFGGRYFRSKEDNKTYTMNELVAQFSASCTTLNDTKENELKKIELRQKTIVQLRTLDHQGTILLQTATTIQKIMSDVKKLFGNLFFKREAILSSIENYYERRIEYLDTFDELVFDNKENWRSEENLYENSYKRGTSYCLSRLNLERIEKQKEKILFSDALSDFGRIRHLQHVTSLKNFQKILETGELRGGAAEGFGFECDSRFLYTQAMTDSTEVFSFPEDQKKRLFFHSLKTDERESVYLILDRELLRRHDYSAAFNGNYGPFGAPEGYFGLELRKLEDYQRKTKEAIIPSIDEMITRIGQEWMYSNEVCFLNPIDLKKHLIAVVLPEPNPEIMKQLEKQYGFNPVAEKINQGLISWIKS